VLQPLHSADVVEVVERVGRLNLEVSTAAHPAQASHHAEQAAERT
jgi:hypothetical protein